MTGTPSALACAPIAARSAISRAGFETVSVKKARVLSSAARAKFSGSWESTKRTSMPTMWIQKGKAGAPGGIRTPDPQVRSLMAAIPENTNKSIVCEVSADLRGGHRRSGAARGGHEVSDRGASDPGRTGAAHPTHAPWRSTHARPADAALRSHRAQGRPFTDSSRRRQENAWVAPVSRQHPSLGTRLSGHPTLGLSQHPSPARLPEHGVERGSAH